MRKASKDNPLISVVIPVYNVSEFLPRCLDSVLAQTYKNLEIILVNDGSTDDSKVICEKYCKLDKRFVLVNKKNGGLSDARNKGIDIAKGEYICFIDSDDYVDTDYVGFLYGIIVRENVNISVCGYSAYYGDNEPIISACGKTMTLHTEDALRALLEKTYDGYSVSACGKMYKTALFSDIRYPKGRLFEDAATTYLLIDKCDVIGLDLKSKYNYMMRKTSIVNNSFNESKLDLLSSTAEMCDYVAKKYPKLKSSANCRNVYAYLSTLMQLSKCSKRNKKVEKKLISYIRKHAFSTVFSKSSDTRDKFGVLCAVPGFRFFKFSWNLYAKKTRRVIDE